jgi:sugar phosphate isomerase/epimerase
MVQPEQVDASDLRDMLAAFGMRMTMFATGATAISEGLSLSAQDKQVRLNSVRRCIDFLDLAAQYGAGIIVGFLKGGVSPEPERARDLFRDSLARIEPHARSKRAHFHLEASNRYESSVANSLADAAELIAGFDNPYLRILPDTFHMNIEEDSLLGSLVRYRGLYDSLHISDNNRRFPGLGGLDFLGLFRFLVAAGYRGEVAIEGQVSGDFAQELSGSMRLIAPMLSQLA